MSAVEHLQARSAGIRAHTRMPAEYTSGTLDNHVAVLFARRGQGDITRAIMPTWGELSIDDPYTSAATGERVYTFIMGVGNSHPRPQRGLRGRCLASGLSGEAMNTRFREGSLEADGGALRLRGTAIVYGSIAGPPKLAYREQIRAGAFGDVSGIDAILNVQHRRDRAIARTQGGGLELIDSPTELRFVATLPETREAVDTVNLVRSGVLRGSSIEFGVPQGGEKVVGGIVTIVRAMLTGIGVVDSPAYADSGIEARAEIRAEGQGIVGAFFYDTPTIISDRAADDGLRVRQARKSQVSPGAFRVRHRTTLSERYPCWQGALTTGRSARKLAGTLELEDTPEALRFSVATLPNTSPTSTTCEPRLHRARVRSACQPLYSIPPESAVASAVIEIEEVAGNSGVFIEVVREAVLTAIAIVTRAPRGNAGEIALRQSRRRLLWL